MDEIAGWIAPAATMIAAMMTAANMGARLTGWGFAVFMIGSLAWCVVGATTGQTNLLFTNGFLAVVNAVGVWRWLGRQRGYEKGAEGVAERSERSGGPALLGLSQLSGMAVEDDAGAEVGTIVDIFLTEDGERISHMIVASGGVAGIEEQLRAVDRDNVRLGAEGATLRQDRAWFEALPVLPREHWPAHRLGDSDEGHAAALERQAEA